MRRLLLALIALLVLAAIAFGAARFLADERQMAIDIEADTSWLLVCRTEGAPELRVTGEGARELRLPPGRIDCAVELLAPGNLRLSATGTRGSRAAVALGGSTGVSRFSLD